MGKQPVENAGADADHRHGDDVVDSHRNAVAAEARFPLHVVKNVGKQRHKDIGAGQPADVLDELPHQHNGHIGGVHPANGTADGVQHKAHRRDIALTEFLRQRPHRKNADPHGNTADNRDQRLGNAVVIGTQHIVAEVDKADVFDGAADRLDQKIGVDYKHIFVGKDCLELPCKGNGSGIAFPAFQRDALFGKVVFQQRQRQSQNGQCAHQRDPLALVHADFGHNDHGEHQGNQNAAHHNGGDLVEYRQTAPLGGISGGQRHHKTMAHIKNGIGKGIKQVVADHDPDRLLCRGAVRHRKQKNARNR